MILARLGAGIGESGFADGGTALKAAVITAAFI